MFFGANDLCSGQCYDKDGTTPLQHGKKLQKALDYLQANLPRTFVNLVPVLGECATGECLTFPNEYVWVHVITITMLLRAAGRRERYERFARLG